EAARPLRDARVELVAMGEAAGVVREARVARPLGRAHRRDESLPVAVGRTGDRDPAILAARRVDGVGRTELAVIADPARDLAVRREARDDLREAVHRSLDLRDVDRLALAGAAAAPQRAEDRGREIARR